MTNEELTDSVTMSPVKSPSDNVDQIVSPAEAASRPGSLQGNASLIIQTRQAQRLVHGRRKTDTKSHIIGLMRFGMNMKRIWSSASRNDPYADWTLLQIEESLIKTRTIINDLCQELENKLSTAASGVQIDIASSLEPISIPLQFANAYGYMGAYLISDYDQLVCTILTARHVGLMDRQESTRQLHQIAQRVRHAFALSGLWKFTMVTRTDFQHGNPKASKAMEVMANMGEMPQEILDGSRRAKIAPEISTANISTVEVMDD
ncbi:MAG: TIGR03761 family integrating conjugative element protein [Gammaproteobacteria bacterium]|nr:TIGR03761 family integrating conjugative element protein [Gammaproteobacteria bacterium]MDH5651237.1 TIGR03761 family integrating conjugative element protein [Gammaproteobacteria bacterium]